MQRRRFFQKTPVFRIFLFRDRKVAKIFWHLVQEEEMSSSVAVSSSFLWRRVHSLLGLWLVLFLFEHLLVNSQAALWWGDEGSLFVRMVNSLESLPFLHVVEWLFIGAPILLHGAWGIKRALEAKTNAYGKGGKSPHLPFSRNRAFTWQRWTSWILVVGIAAHVVEMRFWNYPREKEVEGEVLYESVVSKDPSLEMVAKRLGVSLREGEKGSVVVEAKTPGAAMLFMVRDRFQSPLLCCLYTIFVLAAVFHACNGLWTALLTWGIALSYKSQQKLLPLGSFGAILLAFLGLAAIWGSYWVRV